MLFWPFFITVAVYIFILVLIGQIIYFIVKKEW